MRSRKSLKPEQISLVFDAPGLVAGVDEAGRGPLAGPVVAAAVILDELKPIRGLKPAKVLVDGNRLPVLRVPAEAIVKGDAKVKSISAASILAKVHRDRLCSVLDEAHPQYGFATHKGYPTPEHLAALRTHGACAVHRRSFGPVRVALGGPE